ncbi:putative carboxylesterase [Dioscorea sansibarensis]
MNPSWLTLLIFPWFSCLFVTLSMSRVHYTSLFSFGYSLSDTGNLVLSTNRTLAIDRLPYGMTYFHHPTCRSSDGHLVIDFMFRYFTCTFLSIFVTEALGLPFLAPYLEQGTNFNQGANFAVSGATALDPDKSLFLVGEIGGNDYNYPLIFGKNIVEVLSNVRKVVHAVTTSVKRLINQGVIHLVVAGILPMGCSANFLMLFYTSNKAAYNPRSGRLKQLNSFAEYHNSLLRNSLGWSSIDTRKQRSYMLITIA